MGDCVDGLVCGGGVGEDGEGEEEGGEEFHDG